MRGWQNVVIKEGRMLLMLLLWQRIARMSNSDRSSLQAHTALTIEQMAVIHDAMVTKLLTPTNIDEFVQWQQGGN